MSVMARRWQEILVLLGRPAYTTLGGLRAGGATDHFLQHQDIPRLRRRARWTGERTLERYVQEGAYFLTARLEAATDQVWLSHLASLAVPLLLDPAFPPPSLPAVRTVIGGGRRSARRQVPADDDLS